MPYRYPKSWGGVKPPPGTPLNWGDPINVGAIAVVPFPGGGQIAANLSGAYNLTGTSTPAWNPGAFGSNAPRFNGTSNYFADTAGVKLAANSDVTISLWANIASPGSAGSAFSIGNLLSDRCQAHLPFTDGNVYWDLPNTANGRVSTSYSGYFSRWTHVAFVGGTGFRAIYLNGTQKVSSTAAVTFGALTGLWLGAWPANFSWWNGALDNVRVFNRRLTPTEVLRLYNEPFAGFIAPRRRIISGATTSGKLFLQSSLSGLGAGGQFFHDRLA